MPTVLLRSVIRTMRLFTDVYDILHLPIFNMKLSDANTPNKMSTIVFIL